MNSTGSLQDTPYTVYTPSPLLSITCLLLPLSFTRLLAMATRITCF